MIKHNLENCKHLILFTSESCNLSCSYCDMAQHMNKKCHDLEAKKVKTSLINGEYFNTIKHAFFRLGLDSNKIECVDFWGQEPTLTLNEMCEFFPLLYELCPNINNVFFSTNGVAFTDKIIKFINMLNKIIHNDFRLNIQFSYDGKTNTELQRGISSSIIINNINKCLLELNKIQLKENFVIDIQLHNVIDDTIIKKYSNKDNLNLLYDYLYEFDNLSKKFINLNSNHNVKIIPFSPGIISPFNASVEEGRQLVKFYQNCEEIGSKFQYKNWKGLAHQVVNHLRAFPYEHQQILLNNIYNNNIQDFDKLKRSSSMLGCNFNYASLKIRYDGTLIHCQQALIGLTEEELLSLNKLNYKTQQQKILHNFYPNIFTDSDEILNQYFYQTKLLSEDSYPLIYSQTLNLMLMLLQSNQIDQSYKNINKLLKHTYMMSFLNGCPINNMIETGNLIGRTAGKCRFMCNGFLDICENLYDEIISKGV